MFKNENCPSDHKMKKKDLVLVRPLFSDFELLLYVQKLKIFSKFPSNRT